MLMTFTPIWTAYIIAAATSSSSPYPDGSKALRLRILILGAVPAIPVILFVSAANIPAI